MKALLLTICSAMLLNCGLEACVTVGPGGKYTVDSYGSSKLGTTSKSTPSFKDMKPIPKAPRNIRPIK